MQVAIRTFPSMTLTHELVVPKSMPMTSLPEAARAADVLHCKEVDLSSTEDGRKNSDSCRDMGGAGRDCGKETSAPSKNGDVPEAPQFAGVYRKTA